jgi:hypothetical protein
MLRNNSNMILWVLREDECRCKTRYTGSVDVSSLSSVFKAGTNPMTTMFAITDFEVVQS